MKKKGISKRSNHYCRIFNISCNSNNTFYDHANFRLHLNKTSNQQADLLFSLRNRDRPFTQDFAKHSTSSADFHLETIHILQTLITSLQYIYDKVRNFPIR